MTTTKTRCDIAAHISEKILSVLAQGAMPWRKPWDGARAGPALPRRVTGELYRGVNIILLWSRAQASGFQSPFWLSFTQAAKLGAQVRRGERGETVVFYGAAKRALPRREAENAGQSFRFLKTYLVFNADQIEGLSRSFHPPASLAPPMASAAHEAWFAKLEIARVLSRDISCYMPISDQIAMPALAAFDSVAQYCATLNHECVHATGAEHRVGRDLTRRFSREARAVEELIAEIGAAILGAHMRLPPHHIFDHSAYIGSWMNVLAHDKRAFLFAAGQAQVAVDWLLTKSPAPEACDVAA